MRRSTWCCTPTPPRPTARTLRRFDFIIGSIHGQFRLDRAAQTERLVRAASNPFVTVIGHMTGRQLLRRSGYELDIDRRDMPDIIGPVIMAGGPLTSAVNFGDPFARTAVTKAAHSGRSAYRRTRPNSDA